MSVISTTYVFNGNGKGNLSTEVMDMEFLVIGRAAPGELSGDQIEWMKQGVQQFRDDPRTKGQYGFAGEPAGCIICSCNSAAELHQYLSLNPLSLMTDWEVHPLITAEEIMQTVDMLEKHVKAA